MLTKYLINKACQVGDNCYLLNILVIQMKHKGLGKICFIHYELLGNEFIIVTN